MSLEAAAGKAAKMITKAICVFDRRPKAIGSLGFCGGLDGEKFGEIPGMASRRHGGCV